MAHSYTPGLRVSKAARIVKERRLPLRGDVKVKLGDSVGALTVVASTDLPGNVHPVNCAGQLGIVPSDIDTVMTVNPGDPVEKDQVIALSKSFFGLFKSTVTSPISGTMESVSPITGQLIMREKPIPVEIMAYLDGKVTNVFPEEGIEVETVGTFIQGIFGVGGERYGRLKLCTDSPDDIFDEDKVGDDVKNCILVGGRRITLDAYHRAAENGAAAIVVGGLLNFDLRTLLGYELGVAITGHEDLKTTLILTEGFGEIAMARRTFDLLAANDGRFASVSGATQIRAGVIRPEVIIPTEDVTQSIDDNSSGAGLEIGDVLRVIRQPHFGVIGKVTALPPMLQKLETGAVVRVLELELNGGDKIILPRANVEIIEE